MPASRTWISHVTFPKPEDDVLEKLLRAVDSLKDGETTYDIPEVVDVKGEWSAYQANADQKAPLPDVSEEERYKLMMNDVKEDVTVLFFHGGAYYLLDTAAYRAAVGRLAKATGGRCFSVSYRLAPQAPFPAAILDALVAYLSLLSPPPGSFHEPVPANKIVFAGDSAGGNLSIVLLQVLLTLRRLSDSPTMRFHGRDVPIELPAGAGVCCPWLDVSRSLPANTLNAPFDYLPPPEPVINGVYQAPQFPPDKVWPASPPRVEFYCNANALTHPLVSPTASPKEIWKDCPPVFIGCAQDCLEDDGMYFARKLANLGGTVQCERFEGMPHVLPVLGLWSEIARKFLRDWGQFCVKAAKGAVESPDGAMFADYTGTKTEIRKWDTMGVLKDEEVYERIKEGRDIRVVLEKEMQDAWTRKNGPKL
ncbi:hypothetical protein KEM56_002652 [Ascosphaera pollenicola]|nr:hypothetical protein KEM56_002652 [Ascosphaera pollenicola]